MSATMQPTMLGRRIRRLRKAQQLSLRALAKKSGVSFATISRVERGMEPEFNHIVALAYALGLTPIQLLSGINLRRDTKTWEARRALPRK